MRRIISIAVLAPALFAQSVSAEQVAHSSDNTTDIAGSVHASTARDIVHCMASADGDGLSLLRERHYGERRVSIRPYPASLSSCPARPIRAAFTVAANTKSKSKRRPTEASNLDVREVSPLEGLYVATRTAVANNTAVDEEFADRRQIEDEARRAFNTHNPKPDVENLERIFRTHRETKARTKSGVWKLTVAYSFLSDLYVDWTSATEQSLALDKPTLDEWSARFPDSPTPYVIRAEIDITHTFALMKDQLAREKFPGGVDALKAKLASAKAYLETHKEIASNDPQWYVLMMRVQKAQQAPVEDIVATALSGAEKHRGFQDIYFEAVRAIGRLSRQPLDDIEALANTAVKLTEAEQGDELYARIYWVALREAVHYEQLPHIKWNWARMTSSMQRIASQYPAQWNLENFAQFSCMAQDKSTLKDYISQIKRRPDLRIWGQLEYFEACRTWAISEAGNTSSDGEKRKATFGQN